MGLKPPFIDASCALRCSLKLGGHMPNPQQRACSETQVRPARKFSGGKPRSGSPGLAVTREPGSRRLPKTAKASFRGSRSLRVSRVFLESNLRRPVPRQRPPTTISAGRPASAPYTEFGKISCCAPNTCTMAAARRPIPRLAPVLSPVDSKLSIDVVRAGLSYKF
jgi:hypothetical protein